MLNRTSVHFSTIYALLAAVVGPYSFMSAADAQGMAEMGGVHAASSVIQINGGAGVQGLGKAVNKLYSPAGDAGTGGGGSAGSSTSSVIVPGPPVAWPDKVNATNASAQANKFLSSAQQSEKAGKTAEALENYRKSTVIRARLWGYRDPAIASIMTSMGKLYSKQHDLKNAELCYRQALTAAIRSLGQGEYQLCPYLNRLATNLYDQKRYEESYSFEKQVHVMQERRLGIQSTDTTGSALMLARICYQVGSLKEATALLTDSIEIKQRLGDTTSNQLLDLLDTYSLVLKKKGDNDQADKLDARAAEIRKLTAQASAPPADAAASAAEGSTVGASASPASGASTATAAANSSATPKANLPPSSKSTPETKSATETSKEATSKAPSAN